MKKFMLRTVAIIVIAVMTMSVTTNAQQKGNMAVGTQLGFGSGPSFVLGGKVQYGITDLIRLDASLNGLWGAKITDSDLVKVTTNGYDLSLNAHYLFSLANKSWNKNKKTAAYVYPLGGVGIYKVTSTIKSSFLGVSEKYSEKKIGLNIGFGAERYLSNDSFSFFSEHKLGLGKDLCRYTGLFGIAYHF